MLELLAKILCEGASLQGLREALVGLHKVRHTALTPEAWAAWRTACEATLDAIYSGAESWGLGGWEVSGDTWI